MELLNVWTGEVYDEDFADPEDSGYLPLAMFTSCGSVAPLA
ncbi:hypothetical protein [Streptomyces sp. NPDC087856]